MSSEGRRVHPDDTRLRVAIDWRPARRWSAAMRCVMLAQAAWVVAMTAGAFMVLMTAGANAGLAWTLAGAALQLLLAPVTLVVALGWLVTGIAQRARRGRDADASSPAR